MRSVDWRRVSPRGRAILRQIELPLALGVAPDEIEARLNLSRVTIRRLRRDLRDELETLAETPPAAEAEAAAAPPPEAPETAEA